MDSTEYAQAAEKIKSRFRAKYEDILDDLEFITSSRGWPELFLTALEGAYWEGRKDVYNEQIEKLKEKVGCIPMSRSTESERC